MMVDRYTDGNIGNACGGVGTGWSSLKESMGYLWLRYMYVFIEDKVIYLDVV